MAKTLFYSLAALVRKIVFCHPKIKFISSHHRVISSIYYTLGSPVEVVVDLHVESFGNIEEANMVRVSFISVNPLSPNSVQDQSSPCNYPYTVKR